MILTQKHFKTIFMVLCPILDNIGPQMEKQMGVFDFLFGDLSALRRKTVLGKGDKAFPKETGSKRKISEKSGNVGMTRKGGRNAPSNHHSK